MVRWYIQTDWDWSELVYVWLLTANLQQEEALERINGKSKQIQANPSENCRGLN